MAKIRPSDAPNPEGNYSSKDLKLLDSVADELAVSENKNSGYVSVRTSDIQHLIELSPKKEAVRLRQHLDAQKGQAYIKMPRSVLETVLESMPYAQSERFFIRRLEGMMQHAAREYVTLPSEDLKRLIALEPKKQKLELEHLLKEQEGHNIKVLTRYVEAAIETYKRDKVPHKYETAIYKAAAVVLILASLPLLFPPSLTGYAFYSASSPIGYGFFNILLGFVSMQKAAKKKLRPLKILSDFEKEVKAIEEMEKWKKSGKK